MNTKISILLLTIILIVGHGWHTLTHIRHLHDAVAARADSAIIAANATRVGLVLHGAIEDGKSMESWIPIRDENLKILDAVARVADTSDERLAAKAAVNAANSLVRLYEDKIFPSKDLISYRGKTEVLVQVIQNSIFMMSEAIAKEADEADTNFNKEILIARSVTLIIGILGILLQAGMVTWLANTSIKIAMRDVQYDDLDNTKDIQERLRDIKKKLLDTYQT